MLQKKVTTWKAMKRQIVLKTRYCYIIILQTQVLERSRNRGQVKSQR